MRAFAGRCQLANRRGSSGRSSARRADVPPAPLLRRRFSASSRAELEPPSGVALLLSARAGPDSGSGPHPHELFAGLRAGQIPGSLNR